MTTTTGGTMNGYHPLSCRPCANRGEACRAHAAPPTFLDDLIAQAIDYSAAADKARHNEAMEAAYTEGLRATIKALAIVLGIPEADAHEMFMAALPD